MSQSSTSRKRYPSLWLVLLVIGFLLASALPASAQNGYPPRSDPYINDFAKVIDAEDASNLRQALADLKSSKGIELAVVTVNSIKDYPTGDATFEAFATHLFNTWGVGDAQRNNGVMLLVAVKDHTLRVELGKSYGSGHSAEMQSIIDNTIVPDFKQGAYSRGIYRGVKAMATWLTGDQASGVCVAAPATSPAQSQPASSTKPDNNSSIELIGWVAVTVIALGVEWFRRRRQKALGEKSNVLSNAWKAWSRTKEGRELIKTSKSPPAPTSTSNSGNYKPWSNEKDWDSDHTQKSGGNNDRDRGSSGGGGASGSW